MGRGRDIFIWCDQDSCGEEIHAEHGWDTYAELTQQARTEGWSIGKSDFCPAHRTAADRRAKVLAGGDLDDGLGPHYGY